MQIFQSHKKVIPTPMNKAEYCLYRKWSVPANEDSTEEGYLVEYLDGGKPNDDRHKGYISWTPKEQFDNGYTRIVPDYQQRVIDEMSELEGKSDKLLTFLKGEKIKDLDPEDAELLKLQLVHMRAYCTVLSLRIDRFSE